MHCVSLQTLAFYKLSLQMHRFMYAAKETSLRKHMKTDFYLSVKLELMEAVSGSVTESHPMQCLYFLVEK